MAKKRRLGDMYIRGKEVTLDDGDGPITVYVRKMSPVDHEAAVRYANAARSTIVAARHHENSDEYKSMMAEVDELTHEELVEYLVLDERSRREPALEAELADEEEWSKEDYLQGLKDAWYDGLQDRYARDPSDEEASRIFGELKRFENALDTLVEKEMQAFAAEMEDKPESVLRANMFEKVLQVRSSLEWLNAYRRQEVYLGTREEDRKTRYFTSRAEVDDLPIEVFLALSNAYRDITVDGAEGKGSEEIPASSSSSDQPDEAVTGASSGPTDVAA